jgi:intergrase/recombinase
MTDILLKKQSFLSGLFELTKRQTEVINEEAVEQLQKVISEKQVIIDRINRLDDEFGEFFSSFKTGLGVETLEQAADISKLTGLAELKNSVKAVKKLINEIHSLELDNSKKAKEVLDELGREIRKVNQGKKITNAYKPAPIVGASYFIDKKE